MVSDERIKDRAAKIGTAAERCARIVKTFLAMARQEPAESNAVDLNERTDAAIEVAGYSLRSADIDVTLRVAPELPFIWGDANQLSQVLTNLVVNAQHALEDKDGDRKLTITSRFVEPSKRVVIEVKDNGPGIPAETQNRIFEPGDRRRARCHRVTDRHPAGRWARGRGRRVRSEALTKIEHRDFNIILSDLRMPNLDGPGLYRILSERKRALLDRVAFVTGDTMSPKARTFLESIPRPCLAKPITPQAVRDLVRGMIRT